ncbi:neuroepithelial cell-transforming gene 1 protein-like [Petaurus breviceps papuanus]|uniref:neuroepithelial cell-transforming gene 1 protein-like n=1 Tax=Petaurus breviceps papuanus TaxID=3040969 RepID=UPI0036DF9220
MELEPTAAESPAPEPEQPQPQPRRRRSRAAGSRTNSADEPEAGLDDPASGPDPRRRYSLRRGSSFTFLTPGPHWDFTLKRKRREKEDDVVSLSSLDLKVIDFVIVSTKAKHYKYTNPIQTCDLIVIRNSQ